MATISIAGRKIGPGEPPYIIAEMSANHNGSLERAIAIVEMAKASGADAIKLQTYKADTITIDYDGPEFLLNEGLWAGRRLYELYQSAAMPWEWHAPLFKRAKEIGNRHFQLGFRCDRGRSAGITRHAGLQGRLAGDRRYRVGPAHGRHGQADHHVNRPRRSPRSRRRSPLRALPDAMISSFCNAPAATRRRPRRATCAPFLTWPRSSTASSDFPTTLMERRYGRGGWRWVPA